MVQKVIVDPVTRIEGHLKVEVDVDGGKVVDARTTGTLFRGIENILKDRDPRDSQHVVQRICGVCPLAHSTAAVFNLESAFGIKPPTNGRILRNLIFGSNYIQSHILHFYHLAALDYVKGPDAAPFIPRYEGDYRLPDKVNAAAVEHYLEALEMRKLAHQMLAIFGGKMPHTPAIVPGGVTEHIDAQKVIDFRSRLKDLTAFIDNVYVPDVLAIADVYKDYLDIGRGVKNLLCYGAFPMTDSEDKIGVKRFYKSGVYTDGSFKDFDPDKIAEDVKYSWFDNSTTNKKGPDGVTLPQYNKKDAYSWLKAPRYDGKPHEVGPLARAWINNEKQIRDLGEKAFSVMGRHAARAIECSKVAHAMDEWLLQLKPGEPVCNPHEVPDHAEGFGLTEAPRGALGHWIRIKDKKIANYNCVVPTTWNAGPRDDQGNRGPIEEALIGTPVKNPAQPIEIVRIVRAFDPCLGCAIHLVTPDKPVQEFQVY